MNIRQSATSTGPPPSRVSIPINGEAVELSAVLLRDACACPGCVHEFSRQRLFSVADIPPDIQARKVEVDTPSDSVKITWNNDLAGYGEDHVTTLKLTSLQDMTQSGRTPGSHKDTFPPHGLWSEKDLNLPDYDYDRYMKDDRFLYQLVNQLRTDGLAFVTNVPGLEESLATIATRIGPVKDTFYGYTWDGKLLIPGSIVKSANIDHQCAPSLKQSTLPTRRTIWASTPTCCTSTSHRTSSFSTASSLPLQAAPASLLMHTRRQSTCSMPIWRHSIPWPQFL